MQISTLLLAMAAIGVIGATAFAAATFQDTVAVRIKKGVYMDAREEPQPIPLLEPDGVVNIGVGRMVLLHGAVPGSESIDDILVGRVAREEMGALVADPFRPGACHAPRRYLLHHDETA